MNPVSGQFPKADIMLRMTWHLAAFATARYGTGALMHMCGVSHHDTHGYTLNCILLLLHADELKQTASGGTYMFQMLFLT